MKKFWHILIFETSFVRDVFWTALLWGLSAGTMAIGYRVWLESTAILCALFASAPLAATVYFWMQDRKLARLKAELEEMRKKSVPAAIRAEYDDAVKSTKRA